ncbi:MAG: hypothetical protein C4324_01065 [Blastocatellia bacterium]
MSKRGYISKSGPFRIYVIAVTMALLTVTVVRNSFARTAGGPLAEIQGVVRNEAGYPIANATIAIFRAGTSVLVKQVQSAYDGSYLARVAPGVYTVLAVAEGYNPASVSDVEVLRAARLVYGFKLQRAGQGDTLPERRIDRNNPKWVRRAAGLSRSIYQNTEGAAPSLDSADVADNELTERHDPQKMSGAVLSYFGSAADGEFVGLNFAGFIPIGKNLTLIVSGQTGGESAPKSADVAVKLRASENHLLRFAGSAARIGAFIRESQPVDLGEFKISASDEWKVREGIILVYGLDFSKLFGAGNEFSLNPRLGFQYDVNPKTRFRSSFTTIDDNRDWSRTIALEDSQVAFRQPIAVDDVVIKKGRLNKNRASRLELGIERILDNRSSITANVFADTVYASGRSVSAIARREGGLIGDERFSVNNDGPARGLALIYNRRITPRVSASAGYSFGLGQKLSPNYFSGGDVFESDYFQSLFGQIDADFSTGTNVKTIFRLSPEATVFAVDPFQNRVAIYDPGLSVLVTQNLPTLGLPIRAEAIVDARNIFDFASGLASDLGTLRLKGQKRMLRGGILVRF